MGQNVLIIDDGTDYPNIMKSGLISNGYNAYLVKVSNEVELNAYIKYYDPEFVVYDEEKIVDLAAIEEEQCA